MNSLIAATMHARVLPLLLAGTLTTLAATLATGASPTTAGGNAETQTSVEQTARSPQPAAEVDSTLVGLWEASRTFDSAFEGEVVVRETSHGLFATVGQYTVAVSRDGNSTKFTLPDGMGRFDGLFDGDAIVGHWIQPATVQSFAEMASPVVLKPVTSGTWKGRVQILADEIHFYLSLRPCAGGRVCGNLQNPEANVGRFYDIHDVRLLDTNEVEFADADGQVIIDGRYDPEWDRLTIYFGFGGGHYDFSRAPGDRTSRFYPRPDTSYSYLEPALLDDGWSTATAEEVGLRRRLLEDLVTMIDTTSMESVDAPQIHALLVARGGKLVLEEYFHGYGRTSRHTTRSAGKSFTTTIVGAAEAKGLLSVSDKVATLLDWHPRDSDVDKASRMTVEHLITMSSGLDCDDWDQNSPGGEDRMQNQNEQPDWVAFTLNQKMIAEPGTKSAYCSASQHLAGAAVTAATDTWLPEFFRTAIAEPLQMDVYHYNLSPVGRGYGGGGIYITARDFLKLGQVFLDGGTWNGKRIVSEEWVHRATRPYSQIGREGYGYGWWVFQYDFGGKKLDAYYAGGNGGQYIIVVPELDLNIVFMGGNFSQRVQHRSKYEYVPQYILPAVTD